MGYYHIAQICLHGHVITDSYDSDPEFRQNFCDKCGSKTITNCPKCNSPIRGNYEVPDFISFNSMNTAPSYCYDCGEPYPWTKESLESIQELLALESNLSGPELEYLNSNLSSVLVDTPKTNIVAAKLKLALGKISSVTSEAIHNIIVDIASETAKKIIYPE